MPYVNVGEENSGRIQLYYEDHGSGKPVVLIHGFPLSSTSWEKQIPVLMESGYRVITYDRRGFGDSSRPVSGYDYNTFAADLNRLMVALDLHEVALVGFSMGTGEIARYLGTYGCERVRKAAFVSSIAPFLLRAPDNPTGLEASVFDDMIAMIMQDRPAFLSSFLVDFYNVDVFGGVRISDEVVRYSWNVAVTASATGTLDCIPAWLTDFRYDVATIDLPALVVHGSADRIMPIESTAIPLHASLKRSELVILDGAPHGLLWTHGDEVNAALVDFLQ
jgi:non-heme chloroperoxidase